MRKLSWAKLGPLKTCFSAEFIGNESSRNTGWISFAQNLWFKGNILISTHYMNDLI